MDKNIIKELKQSELFDLTFCMYKKGFVPQIVYSLIVNTISSVVIYIVAFIGAFAIILQFIPEIINNNGAFADEYFTSILIGMFVIVAIVVVVSLVFSSASYIGNYYINQILYHGGKPSIGQSLAFTLKSIPRVLSVSLCEFLVIAPISAVLLGAIAAFVYLMYLQNFTGGLFVIYVISAVLMYIAFIFVTIYFSVIWVAATPLAIFEKKKFFYPLKQSINMVKGNIKSLLGTYIVWYIIITFFSNILTSGIMLVIGLSSGFFSGFNDLYQQTQFSLVLNVINLFVTPIIAIVVQPLGAILNHLVYSNLQIKKYGYDLQCRLDKVLLPYREKA